MSDQSQATANAPSEPRLCKMGCGFFGNGATGDCCSKCWRELQKKDGVECLPVQNSPKEEILSPEPMDMELEQPQATQEVEAPAPTLKKKKKKASYKSMMATMMKGTDRDAEQEKESLRRVTGGGAFSKIDKI